MATNLVATPVEQPISMKDTLTCSICRELFYQPIRMMLCDHSFCGHCVAGVFKHNPRSSCPTCRGEVKDAVPDHKTQALLDLFLAANPGFALPQEDIEAFEKEYKHGDAIDGIPNKAPNHGNMVGPVPGDFIRQELETELDLAEDYVVDAQHSLEHTLRQLEAARNDLDEASESAKHTYSEWVNCSRQADQQGDDLSEIRLAASEIDRVEVERTEADALDQFTTLTQDAGSKFETLVQAQDAVRRARYFLKALVVRERILRLGRLRERQRRREAAFAQSSRAGRRSTSRT